MHWGLPTIDVVCPRCKEPMKALIDEDDGVTVCLRCELEMDREAAHAAD